MKIIISAILLPLLFISTAFGHGSSKPKTFEDLCNLELDRFKRDCPKVEEDKMEKGRINFSECRSGASAFYQTKVISAEDGGKIGARMECRTNERRKDGSQNIVTINSLGSKQVMFLEKDGGREFAIYPKGGGMLDCSMRPGDEKYTWCGINEPNMLDPKHSYDFIKKAPTAEEFLKLIGGTELNSIFPHPTRTLEIPKWHIHSKPAPARSFKPQVPSEPESTGQTDAS